MLYHDITCRQWEIHDLDNILLYLLHLSAATKQRFEPHPFTLEALQQFYHHPDYTGWLMIENNSTYIIGYAIIKKGYLEHDYTRLNAYQIMPNRQSDATYAPSLADDWQGKGVGQQLWTMIRAFLQSENITRVILWGGVQADNKLAVNYYKRNGFYQIGTFAFNGKQNLDMICVL